MNKTVLVPTDFTIRSLNLLKSVLNRHQGEKINIILCHGFEFGSSVTDLLFYSKKRILSALKTDEFEKALQVIRNKYDSGIESLRTEAFFGSTHSAFANFIEGNKVDEAYSYVGYKPKFSHHASFDVAPYVLKLSDHHKIPYEGYEEEKASYESFADLFFSKIAGYNR